MVKKKLTGKKSFVTKKEMDMFLEENDLGEIFAQYGSVHKPKIRKVNIDLPEWLISQLDLEANRAGISRQPLIKLWLLQKLDDERRKRSA